MNIHWEIEFYELSDGCKPVFDFIDSLPTKDKAKVVNEIELLEDYGIELGPPKLCKIKGKRHNGLRELRIRFSSNYYRILYFKVEYLCSFMVSLRRRIKQILKN